MADALARDGEERRARFQRIVDLVALSIAVQDFLSGRIDREGLRFALVVVNGGLTNQVFDIDDTLRQL